MVCIGKFISTNTSCLIFKIDHTKNEKAEKTIIEDPNNVFVMCPAHVLKEDTFKLKVQILFDERFVTQTAIYVTVCFFPIYNTFLDIAMGVVENPEIINNSEVLKELCYLTYDVNIYNYITNKDAQILFANSTGVVNILPTKVQDINYEHEFQNQNLIKTLPSPGGYILTKEPAKKGFSGGVLVIENNIVGMITASSKIGDIIEERTEDTRSTDDDGNMIATDMFYIYPYMINCVHVIDQFTHNKPENLKKLCNYTQMKELKQDLKPVVNHLGAEYIFNSKITDSNLEKSLKIKKIQFNLNYIDLKFCQENTSNSIPVENILNSNKDFVDFFFDSNGNELTEIICRYAKYTDVEFGETEIDFVNNTSYANLLDYSYRGDPSKPLMLRLQKKIFKNDGSVELADPQDFSFNPVKTVDIINEQKYIRWTSEVPANFFNQYEGFIHSSNGFGSLVQETNQPADIKLLLRIFRVVRRGGKYVKQYLTWRGWRDA